MNCTKCGAQVAEGDTFCGSCGNPVAQAPAAPAAPPMGSYAPQKFVDPATGVPLAEWWQRAVALIIDDVIVGIPTFIVLRIIVAIGTTTTTDQLGFQYRSTSGAALLFGYVVVFAVWFGYFVFFTGRGEGQTPGKMAMGIGVRIEGGAAGAIGFGKAAGRYGMIFVMGIIPIVLLIDYLSPLWDPRRQAWHDKVAKTSVVTLR